MKKIISVLLAITMLFSVTATVSAESEKSGFTDIEDVRRTINEIYDENYDEFTSLVGAFKNTDLEGDKYFTYVENCGPCSTAFQKILYDNGIIVENQRPTTTYGHVYNMLRTSYVSSPDIETDIVIDTTYKQFLTGVYNINGYTYDDMASELPKVLIYEYGNIEQLRSQLSALYDRFGVETADKTVDSVLQANYYFKYQISDFQHIDYPGYTHSVYSSEFIEDLRSNNGKLSVKLEDTLIINSTTSELKKEFLYDMNGVYRCYLTNQEFKEIALGFNIVNQNSELMYGANENTNTLYLPTNLTGVSYGTEYIQLINSKGKDDIRISVNSTMFSDVFICIDFGSGLDTPSIYTIPVAFKYSYGDVNMDGTVNINDVTYLQKSIAQYSGYTLNENQKSIADVTKTEPLNIENATAISKKLAELKDFEYGETLYFSQYIKLGFNKELGYIDF